MVEQDARVELHEQQPGIEGLVTPVMGEYVVPSLGEGLGQCLRGQGGKDVGTA